MGEDDWGSPSFTKSVHSLLEALATLEREIEIIVRRAGASPMGNVGELLAKAAGVLGEGAVRGWRSVDFGALLQRAGALDAGEIARTLTAALGVADETSVETLRGEVREVVEQVTRLRERELALAGGVSQLRARSARFEEALAGLARVQGKCVARLDHQVDRARKLEQLSGRRDDHITRLIRDTAAQRAELERMRNELGEAKREQPAEDAQIAEIRAKIAAIESQYQEAKKLQTVGTRRVIETLEAMRDRVSKLEARAVEMSREARAKGGRLDALARHVATVEGRLTSAIGKRGESMVPVTGEVDKTIQATG